MTELTELDFEELGALPGAERIITWVLRHIDAKSLVNCRLTCRFLNEFILMRHRHLAKFTVNGEVTVKCANVQYLEIQLDSSENAKCYRITQSDMVPGFFTHLLIDNICFAGRRPECSFQPLRTLLQAQKWLSLKAGDFCLFDYECELAVDDLSHLIRSLGVCKLYMENMPPSAKYVITDDLIAEIGELELLKVGTHTAQHYDAEWNPFGLLPVTARTMQRLTDQPTIICRRIALRSCSITAACVVAFVDNWLCNARGDCDVEIYHSPLHVEDILLSLRCPFQTSHEANLGCCDLIVFKDDMRLVISVLMGNEELHQSG